MLRLAVAVLWTRHGTQLLLGATAAQPHLHRGGLMMPAAAAAGIITRAQTPPQTNSHGVAEDTLIQSPLLNLDLVLTKNSTQQQQQEWQPQQEQQPAVPPPPPPPQQQQQQETQPLLQQQPLADAAWQPRASSDHASGLAGLPAARQGELRNELQRSQLSISAIMAVLRYSNRKQLQPAWVGARVAELQRTFGGELADQLLAGAPQLLQRSPQTLAEHLEGLVAELGAGRAYTLGIVRRIPDILQHRPSSASAKVSALQELFQADRKALLRLLTKAPALLKLRAAHIQPVLDFLCSAGGGLERRAMLPVFLAWPVLATTSVALLQQRYDAVASLLGASPEEMPRIARVFPNLLGRDPQQLAINLDAIASGLGVDRAELVELARREPGILAWNPTSLVSRVVGVAQVLRLEGRASLCLLSYQRPLLSLLPVLPERLEALRSVLRVNDEELHVILRSNMSLLRLPRHMVAARFACLTALAELRPAWAEGWRRLGPSTIARILLISPAPHWRLAYLVHTGQQESVSFIHALRMSAQHFETLYPCFADWIDRYNMTVLSEAVPLAPLLPENMLTGGDSNSPSSSSSSSSSGNSQTSSAAAAAETGPAGSESPPRRVRQRHSWVQQPLGEAVFEPLLRDPGRGRNLHATGYFFWGKGTSAASTHLQELQQQQQQLLLQPSVAAVAGDVPSTDHSKEKASGVERAAFFAVEQPLHTPTPAMRLADWLGIELQSAEQLLQEPSLACLSLAKWQTRLAALASLLEAGGHSLSSPPVQQQQQQQQEMQQQEVQHKQKQQQQQPRRRRTAVQQQGKGATDALHATVAVTVTATAAAASLDQVQEGSGLPLEALRMLLNTGTPAALAPVLVATSRAPFCGRLHVLPPRPPPLVVGALLLRARTLGRKFFPESAPRLATLAASSPQLAYALRELSIAELVELGAAAPVRMAQLQYLLDSSAPVPWAFGLQDLLLNNAGCRSAFCAAYPGYIAWEQRLSAL